MIPPSGPFSPVPGRVTIEGVDAAVTDLQTADDAAMAQAVAQMIMSQDSTGVTAAVALPGLPAGLLSIRQRQEVVLQAKGFALPSSDYALWAFLLVSVVAWAPYLAGSRPDVAQCLQWQLAAIPLAIGVRWLVDLANSLAAGNALEVLRADARAREQLSQEQWQEYLRRESSISHR